MVFHQLGFELLPVTRTVSEGRLANVFGVVDGSARAEQDLFLFDDQNSLLSVGVGSKFRLGRIVIGRPILAEVLIPDQIMPASWRLTGHLTVEADEAVMGCGVYGAVNVFGYHPFFKNALAVRAEYSRQHYRFLVDPAGYFLAIVAPNSPATLDNLQLLHEPSSFRGF